MRNRQIICITVVFALIFGFSGCKNGSNLKSNSIVSSSSVFSAVSKQQTINALPGVSSNDVQPDVKVIQNAHFKIEKKGLPILLYHDIMTPSQKGKVKNGLVVTTDDFDRQMLILKKAGYTTASLQDVDLYIRGKKQLENKAVITFDDGYKTNCYLAAPILKKYDFKATVFVISKYVTAPDEKLNVKTFFPLQYLNDNDIKQYSDTLDFESHTDNMHIDLTKVKSSDKILKDLSQSRAKLKNALYFAYPLGKQDTTVIELVKKAGFRLAFTTQFKRAEPGMNPYTLPRLEINAPVSDSRFMKILGIKTV